MYVEAGRGCTPGVSDALLWANIFPSHMFFTYSIGTSELVGGFITPESNVTVAVPRALFMLVGNVYIPLAWNMVEFIVAMFQAPSNF